MKKISVIIPIYNVEKYLKRCIESIIKQTYSNLEIILVDDGSPDGCAKICDEYKNKDERIVVIHKKNGGLSDARNAGLKVATGEIISYIDSDDYVDLDMYEKMTKAMEEKNADIVVCGTNIDYEDGHTKVKCEKEEKSFNREEALIELNSFKSFDMAVWNKLYKREVVDKIEFPVGKKSEDYFVMYQYFARAKKVVIINQAKYHYFQRSNSISRGKNVTHDYIEGSKSQKEFFKKSSKRRMPPTAPPFTDGGVPYYRYGLTLRTDTSVPSASTSAQRTSVDEYDPEYRTGRTRNRRRRPCAPAVRKCRRNPGPIRLRLQPESRRRPQSEP